MSLESAQNYIRRLREDPDFAFRVQAAVSPEMQLRIIRDTGLDFTPDELRTVLRGPPGR